MSTDSPKVKRLNPHEGMLRYLLAVPMRQDTTGTWVLDRRRTRRGTDQRAADAWRWYVQATAYTRYRTHG